MTAPSQPNLLFRVAALVAGPASCVVVLLALPETFTNTSGNVVDFTWQGRAALAVLVWMGIWWMSEALPLAATSLLPILLFPLLGVFDVKDATAPYANPLIFLYLGGFVIALSMQRWALGQRIALIMLRMVGPRPRLMIAGFMVITAFFSAFVSNTATTAMMLPIALSLIALVGANRSIDENKVDADEATEGSPSQPSNFATGLLLGLAYSASIGGVATIIGTPPNALLVAFLRDSMPPDKQLDVGFAQWMTWGVPLAALFLPLTWFVLTFVIYPVGDAKLAGSRKVFTDRLQAMGPMQRGELMTLVVFLTAATMWITRPWLTKIEIPFGQATLLPLAGLSDTGIAIGAAMLLFVLPHAWRPFTPVMNWQTAEKLPWGVLLLFGGGLSLAAAIAQHGVADYFASWGAQLQGVPEWVIVLAVTTAVVFLTEMTSNTATVAGLLPVLIGLAVGLGVDPYLLMFPTAMAASCAFMLPVATPPNAIVFGSGYIEIRDMMKAGLWMNFLSVVLVVLVTYLLVKPLLMA